MKNRRISLFSLYFIAFCALILAFTFSACRSVTHVDKPAQEQNGMSRCPNDNAEKAKVSDNGANKVEQAKFEKEQRPSATKSDTDDALAADGRRFIEDEKNTIQIFEQAAPGTVFVTQSQIVRDWRTASALEVPAGTGTGFIWDKDGHIVTNFHIIAGGSSWSVTLYNQKTYTATLAGGDRNKDIAVLKINAPTSELEPIKLPPEDATLSVGQKAIAIGNPFGLDHTLTTGIISAIGRDMRGFGGVTIKEMVQTDASINPGNSGGPLLNSKGELIGMNTMILSRTGTSSGIGFALPISVIRRIVPQIIKTGRAEQVGLGILTIPDNVARRYGVRGVMVQAVMENSDAQRAGLQGLVSTQRGYVIGDIIVGIDDAVVRNLNDLYTAIDGHNAGDVVSVKILRNGKPMTLNIQLFVIND
jgi:S1-C subfamily serine protease